MRSLRNSDLSPEVAEAPEVKAAEAPVAKQVLALTESLRAMKRMPRHQTEMPLQKLIFRRMVQTA